MGWGLLSVCVEEAERRLESVDWRVDVEWVSVRGAEMLLVSAL